jgi:hypothetical protein
MSHRYLQRSAAYQRTTRNIPARNRRNAPSKVTAAAEPLGLVRTHVAQSMFGTDDSGARHRSCGRRRTCSATSRRTLPRICHASRQMRRAAPVALRTRHLARAAPLSAEKTGTADGFDAKAANAARYIAAAVSAKLSPPAPAKRRAFGAELCKDGRSASRRGTTGCAKGRALQQVVLRACVATGCTAGRALQQVVLRAVRCNRLYWRRSMLRCGPFGENLQRPMNSPLQSSIDATAPLPILTTRPWLSACAVPALSGTADSGRRLKRAQSRCRRGMGEFSPGADVAAVRRPYRATHPHSNRRRSGALGAVSERAAAAR